MPCPNKLFVAYKPAGISSNRFLSEIKRRYHVKKAGFSGTLDPFAKGVLIVAFGQYTKLFRFLKKTPKRYRATLWLGAESETLDIEKVERIIEIPPFQQKTIEKTLEHLKGKIRYLPPRYSAKKIGGRRAYDLARQQREFALESIESEIYDLRLIHYAHPFVTFEVTISEGGYIRSIGALIAERLGVSGILSALERLGEGDFVYENERPLNPPDYIDLPRNRYLGDSEDILLGRKLDLLKFEKREEGEYILVLDKIVSIIEIRENRISYLVNGIQLC